MVLLGLLHFFWMRSGKNDFGEVAVYAAIVAVLLGWRLWRRWRCWRPWRDVGGSGQHRAVAGAGPTAGRSVG